MKESVLNHKKLLIVDDEPDVLRIASGRNPELVPKFQN